MGDHHPQRPNDRSAQALIDLERGRDAYSRRAWADAHQWLLLADQAAGLGTEDLERLAVAAYLIGREEDYLRALDRAHHACLGSGDCVHAARCAFWMGLRLLLRGETGPATGWFGRARRLLERAGRTCVEEGYLLLPIAEQHLAAGNGEAAYAAAMRAAEIGECFNDADLSACARHQQGRALMQQRQVAEGLALLDEAMIAAAAGELSPIMTGLIYCSVIDACQQVQALDRAREWTAALAEWCAAQPQLVAFTSTCLVHRAEILQVSGAWRDALEEARRASAVSSAGTERRPPPAAFYQLAEMHRLRGELMAAEVAYRQASQRGCEPQPGLALLRLAQGRTAMAVAAIRRALDATAERLSRARLLPACVEIMLAADEVQEARAASRELEGIAEEFGTPVLRAAAAQAAGAIALAEGDARAAFVALRRAFGLWQQVRAPYFAARVREMIGLACRALDDAEAARLERDAARAVFQALGAAPDLARLASPHGASAPARRLGLTGRELQVLRLLAAGRTNKAIAIELCLSEKTIDRHVSNIFDKLDIRSRTAAVAWAYEHDLV